VLTSRGVQCCARRYNNICLKAFGTFNCQALRDGTSILANAPYMVCYDSYEHQVQRNVIALSVDSQRDVPLTHKALVVVFDVACCVLVSRCC
jgi:hypothetical protein